MENNYRERVLEILGEGSEKSTSEIASMISRDFYFTERLLDDMERDKLLIKTKLKNFTYWKLYDGKEIQN